MMYFCNVITKSKRLITHRRELEAINIIVKYLSLYYDTCSVINILMCKLRRKVLVIRYI